MKIKKKKWGWLRYNNKQQQYQGCVKDKRLWDSLCKRNKKNELGNRFDGILSDSPWDETALELGYPVMKDKEIFESIPLKKLQKNGFLFIWVTNKKFEVTLEYLKQNNYKRVELIVWIKLSEDLSLYQGIGYFLQHNCEFCIVAKSNERFEKLKERTLTHNLPNVIIEKVRKGSQKPDQLYDIMEKMLPKSRFLEIFSRPHNSRDKFTSVGNESITYLNTEIVENK
ncbi:MT-A70 family protein [Oxytricha trifallax]|uniref:mRNA m(6)A methyltransferase n=1 Tax=Oxytricha trifallax TaxID=1172189 RepID=A0A073HYG3_9SPIT|nr:MT-A70 family protein [Oxytricha trifallax]